MTTLRELLGERMYEAAYAYACVLHNGDVEAWLRDLVLQQVDAASFQEKIAWLMTQRTAA